MLADSILHAGRAGTAGGPKGSGKNMTVGEEGKEKLDSIEGGRKKFQTVTVFCLAAVEVLQGTRWHLTRFSFGWEKRGGCTTDTAGVWISLWWEQETH